MAYVALLRVRGPDAATKKCMAVIGCAPEEKVTVVGRDLYLHRRNGVDRPTLPAPLERCPSPSSRTKWHPDVRT